MTITALNPRINDRVRQTPGIPAEPTDTHGYDTPGAAGLCWADDWTRERFKTRECGAPTDPDSALGLCTRHEADKQRFNEERGPDPVPAPAVAEREFPYAGMGEVITGAFRSFIDGMAGIGPQLAEAIGSAFSGVSYYLGQAHNHLVRTDGWMEGPGYATSYLTGHRWRDPETGEQWRVAGRRGDKHWIRTGPRRARWWK